ncbi:MAG: FAD-dependent oxidoreductase, partial [Candidatus Wolfebacteria bacterium]|nr:FAD-dependent oxidoreductase [Candidatus Wolfebacteria bacterium]
VLKGDPVTQDKIKTDPKVEILFGSVVSEIYGKEFVEGLKYQDLKTKEIKDLKVQGVFVEIGLEPNSDIVKDLVNLDEYGHIVADPKTQEASLSGIWAAGDVTDCKYRQNNISVGDAIKAVLGIYDYLNKK